MLTRILAATVAGAVTLFLLGWLIYGMLLRNFFDGAMTPAARAVMRTEPDFIPLILAQLAFGGLLAFVFAYWGSIRTFVGGLRGGAILYFLIVLGFDLQMMAFFQNMHTASPWLHLVVDVIAATVLGALGGGVVGQVLGMMDKGGE
jgi:hypothetical protein